MTQNVPQRATRLKSAVPYGRDACGPSRLVHRHAGVGAGPQRPVRLEFPILSLNPGVEQPCVAPDV